MSQTYQHLGIYSDWVQAAQEQQPLFPIVPPGPETQQRVRGARGEQMSPQHRRAR